MDLKKSLMARSVKRAKEKKKQTVPSRTTLMSMAKDVVKEVAGMKENRPNQNYGREIKLMSKKLKDIGMVHTMVDGKTSANRKTMASTLLKAVKGSETQKLLDN
jgi:hypothetical protein